MDVASGVGIETLVNEPLIIVVIGYVSAFIWRFGTKEELVLKRSWTVGLVAGSCWVIVNSSDFVWTAVECVDLPGLA